ncbi:class I SAM-dependent methyltransferase [bacterium]|nr:MAG: class I SAM-dependent methyltransferase [bacterium]
MFRPKKTSRCPYCKREAPLFFQTTDRNRHLSEDIFSYYRCRSCRLVFLTPIPDDLAKYYPSDYYHIPQSVEELGSLVEAQRYKLDIVQKFVKSGRLLEIGPASGDFVYHASQAGFEVETIEMDERCCGFLRDVVGVGAIHSDDAVGAIAEMAPDVSYDVIALWQVIEHLPDFWKTIEAATSRLAEGGILVLAAPNPSSLQFRLLKGYWTHVDAPRHVCLIPIKLLTRHTRKLGLRPVLVTTSDVGSLGWNAFGWRYSFGSFSPAVGRVRGALFRLGSALTFLLQGVERKGLRGSTYTIVLKKGPAS